MLPGTHFGVFRAHSIHLFSALNKMIIIRVFKVDVFILKIIIFVILYIFLNFGSNATKSKEIANYLRNT